MAASGAAQRPTVAVAGVTRRDIDQELTIQGEFRPFQEVTEIRAMVSGYLRKNRRGLWRPRQGGSDTIAVLEAPELGDELAHAVAAHERAVAANAEAHLDFTRLSGVNKAFMRTWCAPQEARRRRGSRDRTTAAEVSAAAADEAKFKTLVGYTRYQNGTLLTA